LTKFDSKIVAKNSNEKNLRQRIFEETETQLLTSYSTLFHN